MNFRTEIKFAKTSPLVLKQTIFSMGSCFADNMSEILKGYRIPTCTNPFGITYNPLSIASSLKRLLSKEIYKKEDLIEDKNLFLSLDHHGDFSKPSQEDCLNGINSSFNHAHDCLLEASVLILTLGTAYVYRDRQSHKVVNNCHRLPASRFDRQLIKSNEILNDLSPVLRQVTELNPKLRILISVSPIRHLRDSFSQNTLSKAQLITAAHGLVEEIPQVEYLPIYEIMMDDLRDYRFYEADMIHPNQVAIDYIWQQFSNTYFDSASHLAFQKIDKLNQGLSHRPRNIESIEYLKFTEKLKKRTEELQQQYPYLNWSDTLKLD